MFIMALLLADVPNVMTKDENNKNTGFPEGVAEKMLLETFRHYQKLADAKFQEMKQQPPKVLVVLCAHNTYRTMVPAR